jgi:hypothetical protein
VPLELQVVNTFWSLEQEVLFASQKLHFAVAELHPLAPQAETRVVYPSPLVLQALTFPSTQAEVSGLQTVLQAFVV